jgi:hypothetical protein
MMNAPMVHAAEIIVDYGGSDEMVRRRDEQCPMGECAMPGMSRTPPLFLASDEVTSMVSLKERIAAANRLKLWRL